MSTPKVWVANFGGHNYSTAEEFGELNFLTRGYVSLGSLDRLFYDVAQSINKTHREDYLLLSGLLAINAVAALTWMHVHSKVKLLVWDQKLKRYRPLEITGDQVDILLEQLVVRDVDVAVD
jgi:hypothetical protein